LKVAQIGVGGWGKNHARVLSQLGVLSAVCDADTQKATEIGQKYGVNQYSSIDRMLESEHVDAVFVCTPTSTHYDIASSLIERKKHVFIEKPMTYRSDEGKKLAELAKKNNVTVTCGYIERFNPAVETVKNLVKSRQYGDLIMLEFHRENRMPLHIKDVGIIYDTSVHDIDTAMWLFDDAPQVVFARSGKIRHKYEDFATIMLGFKDNKVAIISSNWITPAKVRHFNAVCTEGIISGDFLSQEVKIESDRGTEIPQSQRVEPLTLEIKHFLESVESKTTPRVSAQNAVNVTRIAEAALLSSQKGVPIYLELE